MKICNVIFYLRQTNSPEFKYVLSWVVQTAMCLRKRFFQEIPSRDAILDFASLHFSTFSAVQCTKRILDFSQNLAFLIVLENFLYFSTVLAPLHQEPWVFHWTFPLLMQAPTFFQIFGLLHQKSLGFSQEFHISDATVPIFLHIFGPLHQESLSFQSVFPTPMRDFPHAHANMHTMMPTESVKFYRNSDPKQFCL